MSSEFDDSQLIKPSEEADFTPEEKSRLKILEHLKGVALESPRFQAYCDYTDLHASNELLTHKTYNRDMISETIRQRINGTNSYKREYEGISNVVNDYRRELRSTASNNSEEQFKFAHGLVNIKNHEIEKKSQPSSTSPQK